ncbi:hypothetical protein AB0D36_26985 [Streptomyces subrutilus]
MPLTSGAALGTERFRSYGARHVAELSARFGLPDHMARSIRALAAVLPFRVNEYVLSELVDWDNLPHDPIFQMVFPQSGMLRAEDEHRLAALTEDTGAKEELRLAVRQIRGSLNPHPSGQRQLNVPTVDGEVVAGLQHNYREAVLYFPGQGQTCHSYCTYCFRWAQFVGDADLRFAAPGPRGLVDYLSRHPEVDDVLVTGGDPMIAVMMHFTHPRGLETDLARRAVARIRAASALVYCQAPLLARINDDPRTCPKRTAHQARVAGLEHAQLEEGTTARTRPGWTSSGRPMTHPPISPPLAGAVSRPKPC